VFTECVVITRRKRHCANRSLEPPCLRASVVKINHRDTESQSIQVVTHSSTSRRSTLFRVFQSRPSRPS
jgi:hypothetical protein